VPEPPEMDAPKDPRSEWAAMQQGEEVHVNPNDNDRLHLIRHEMDFNRAIKGELPDQDALTRLLLHIEDHKQAFATKQMMQAAASALVDQVAANNQNPEAGGINTNGPIPLGLQQLQDLSGALGGAQDGNGKQSTGGFGGPAAGGPGAGEGIAPA